MNRLVRLYPAAWQQRYGEELSRILEDRPPSPFDVADLLFGAVDAHLHLRGLGNHSEHRKGIPMSLSIAGFASIVSGGLWAVFFVYASTLYGGNAEPGLVWLPFLFVALLTLIVALAGLSGQPFRVSAGARWAAALFPASGVAFAVLGLAIAVISRDLTFDYNEFGAAFLIVGIQLAILGSMGFALVSATLGRFAAVSALAIIAGAVPTLIAFSGGAAAPWMAIGGVAYGAGWIGLGVDAIRRDRSPMSTGHSGA